jgi:DNA polymerase III subunit beta
MQFTIKKEDILHVLQRIQGLTGRTTNLAITRNVLIKAANDSITLTATDLDTGFEGTYPAVVAQEGVIAIHSRKLYEIVRDFPSDEIHMSELENRWLEIGNDTVQYNIVCANPDDFPETSFAEDIPYFEMESAALKKMIERNLMIASDPGDTRAHMNSSFFEKIIEEQVNRIRMVSTDGSRLSLAECIVDKENQMPPAESGVLIPKKELNEVVKFLDQDSTVKIGIEQNRLVIKKDTETIIVRLVEGEFPAYGAIFNSETKNVFKADREKLLMMLKRMSILSSQDYKGALFKFEKNRLKVITTNPEIGESKEEIDIEFDGEPIEISFNPKYFIETLNAIEDDKISARISDHERPCLVEGEKDRTFLSAIMPMRI